MITYAMREPPQIWVVPGFPAVPLVVRPPPIAVKLDDLADTFPPYTVRSLPVPPVPLVENPPPIAVSESEMAFTVPP